MSQTVAAAPVTAVHGQLLLDTAAASIRHGLAHGRPLPVDLQNAPPAVLEPRPVFVTLERRGVVRGCVGRLHSPHPLIRDVADNAYNAAFQDSRFPPLEEPELDGLSLQISVLEPPQPLPFSTEADLLARLVPGRDGLIIQAGWAMALFLPAVWASLPDPAQFLHHLKLKAGLPAAGLPPGLEALRFGTECVSGPMT
jgi:AmmeMemoRadiSam system protein A